jgi:uncharacterized protein YfbU (UPF0304 family)
VQLSRVERALLANQLRILEVLYPNEAEELAQHRTALEAGWEYHFGDALVAVTSDEVFTTDQSREIIDILDMYRHIELGVATLTPDHALAHHFAGRFAGFDGNNEVLEMSYVEYLVEDLGQFEYLASRAEAGFNSHTQTLPQYRRMLSVWRALGVEDRYQLDETKLQGALCRCGGTRVAAEDHSCG